MVLRVVEVQAQGLAGGAAEPKVTSYLNGIHSR
jgi:hypothetical protein